MQKAQKYKVVDHPADIGIIVYGKNRRELFENSAYGMFDLMTTIEKIKPIEYFTFNLSGENIEQLYVNFLTELLYIHEVERVFLSEFNVDLKKVNNNYELFCIAKGEKFDINVHERKLVIKAITYHLLEFNEKKGYAQVIFDV
mgnify:CR=1 FL=1